MKAKKVEKLVRDWFYSDLNIEITARKRNKKITLILESNVWYDHKTGKRMKGDKRRLYVPMEADDDLYEEMKHCTYGCTGKEMNLDETLETLGIIEDLGFKLS